MNRLPVITGWLLSLLIISQSLLVVAAPCSALAPETGAPVADSFADPHAGHHMVMDVEEADESSCCEQGYCSVGGCLSVSALASTDMSLSLPTFADVDIPFHSLAPSSHTESPFRPPISR